MSENAITPTAVSRPLCRDDFKRALIHLVRCRLSSRRRRTVPLADVDGGTPLFESGLVDSLAVLELMAFIEDATGQPIQGRMVHMKHFGTIDRICAAFWREDCDVERAER